jgi:IS5 family transposase
VKVSLATTLSHSKGGQFIVHAKALQGQALRYDGHTLGTVIPEIEKQIGVSLKRIFCDAGYKGHNAPQEHRFKVYTAGQKRKMTDAIKREMRRRAAIEPLIGHAKSDHRMGRNYLAGQAGDAINAIRAAVGYNFRRLLAWLTLLLSTIWLTLLGTNRSHPARVAA